MRFVVSSGPLKAPDSNEPVAFLLHDGWDDYSHQTQFQLYIWLEASFADYGPVKILPRAFQSSASNKRRTIDHLPLEFTRLEPADFCSLGQSSAYYRKLGTLGERGKAILISLNDIVFAKNREWWLNDWGYQHSLLRTRAANLAQVYAKDHFEGRDVDRSMKHRIPFNRNEGHVAFGPEYVEFEFDGTLEVPGRLNVIVGKNATGKTTLLRGLTNWFAKSPTSGTFEYRPKFSRVIVCAFNPFDTQVRATPAPESDVVFVGLPSRTHREQRALDNLMTATPDEWPERLVAAFPSKAEFEAFARPLDSDNNAISRLKRLALDADWFAFLDTAFENDSARFLKGDAESYWYELSAGQKLFLGLFAALFQSVDEQSLVLFDEPENHLHPSLLATFIQKFNHLLDARKAYAIIATHSPIVLQETPSRFVTILHRSEEEGTIAMRPDFETFGESLDNIVERLFETDSRTSHWKAVLQKFAQEQRTIADVESAVSGLELPLLARTYYAYQRIRPKK